MSSDLHPTAIWWDGRRGRARHDGVEVELRRGPPIGKLRPDRIEFDVASHIAQLAERSVDPKREMTAAEISDAKWWLVNLAAKAREIAG